MSSTKDVPARLAGSSLLKVAALGLVTAYALYSVWDLKRDVMRKVDARLSTIDGRIEEYHRSVTDFGHSQAEQVRRLQGEIGSLRRELIGVAQTAGEDLREADRDTRHGVYREALDAYRQRHEARSR